MWYNIFQSKMPHSKLLHLTTSGVGFLVVGLIIVSFKLYDFSEQNKQLKDKISLENSIHQNQISEILKRYDSLKAIREEKKEMINTAAPLEPTLHAKHKHLAVHTGIKKNVLKKLKAINMSARGVRIISNDVVETNVSSKIDQVRVLFTLEANKDIEPGDKQLYIQIVNPKNRLLALKGKLETKLVKEVHYDRLDTDACFFINLHQHQLIVGDYKINLIHKGDVIGSANFRVN